jgi:hypothetical protein
MSSTAQAIGNKPATHTVPQAAVSIIRERVERGQARITKAGLEGGYTLNVGESTRDEHGDWWTEVTLVGSAPVLPGGWALIATIDHSGEGGNIVHIFDETFDDHSLWDAAPDCDHCGYTRQRNTTWIVRNADGDTVQVGTTCLVDFLGHEVSLTLPDGDFFEMPEGGWPAPIDVHTETFVTLCTVLVSLYGYRKSRTAGATAEAALAVLLGRGFAAHELREVLNHDLDAKGLTLDHFKPKALEAITWARGLEPDSGYEHNLKAAASGDFCLLRHTGILGSLPSAYERHLGWVAAKPAEPTAPAPEGRQAVTGVVKSFRFYDNQFGSSVKMLVVLPSGAKVFGTVPASIDRLSWDDEGNRTVEPVDIGDTVTFTATFTRSAEDQFFAIFKRPAKATLTKKETNENR